MRSRVDLPQPEGPTSTVNEPSAMAMSTPCRIGVAPKFFFTDWIVTLAIGNRRASQVAPSIGSASVLAAMRANR